MTLQHDETWARSSRGCQESLSKKSLTLNAFLLELWTLFDVNFVYIFQHVNIAKKKIPKLSKNKARSGLLIGENRIFLRGPGNSKPFFDSPFIKTTCLSVHSFRLLRHMLVSGGASFNTDRPTTTTTKTTRSDDKNDDDNENDDDHDDDTIVVGW